MAKTVIFAIRPQIALRFPVPQSLSELEVEAGQLPQLDHWAELPGQQEQLSQVEMEEMG